MKKKPAKPSDVFGLPTEDEEQMQVIRWAEMSMGRWPDLKWLYHVPNGGKRNKTEAARFKAMGVRAGVPDLCLPVPMGGYHGLYIEMKRREGGKLSKDQCEWIDGLRKNGYCVWRCDGAQQAIAVLEAYMSRRIKESETHVDHGHAAGE